MIKVFSKKNTKSYDFLVKTSDEYIKVIGRVCMRMIQEEQFLDQFRETTLHMLW